MKKIMIIFLTMLSLLSCERNDLYEFAKSEEPTMAVNAGDSKIYLSWKTVSDASAYQIWYNTTNDPSTAVQFGGDLTVTDYTITGLVNGTTYYIWLKVKKTDGSTNTMFSASGTPAAAVLIPAAPGSPGLTSDDTKLTITWTAIPGATAYEIFFNTINDPSSAVKFGTDFTTNSGTVTSLTNGTVYYIWVVAKNTEAPPEKWTRS